MVRTLEFYSEHSGSLWRVLRSDALLLTFYRFLLAALGRVDGESWGMENKEASEGAVGIIQARDDGTQIPINLTMNRLLLCSVQWYVQP